MTTEAKKKWRVAGIVTGSIVALIFVLFLIGDSIVSHVADKQIRRVLSEKYNGYADYGRICIRLWAGTVMIDDIAISSEDSMALSKKKAGFALRVEQVAVRNINILSLARTQTLPSCKIKLKNVQAQVVEDAKNAYMEIGLGALEMEARGVGYNLMDSAVVYNDSLYSLELSDLHFVTPDSLTAIDMQHFYTKNAGPLEIAGLHVFNTVDRRELAVRKGKIPETWADMHLDEIVTSPVNVIRMALAKLVAIDSVHVISHQGGAIFRDARFPAKEPYPMPQEVIRACPIPLAIGNVAVGVDKLDIEIATTYVNSGNLSLSDMKVEIKDVSNKRGAAIRCLIHDAHIGKSRSNGSFIMHLDDKCNFETKVQVRGFELSNLDSLLCPLVGLTAKAEVDTLRAHVFGDKERSHGDFCMIYHDFSVEVHKNENIPYRFITKNAGFVESFANTMLPKSNPSGLATAPRAYKVEWKRDVMSPFPLYMFGPLIDGAVKTMLPGLFVHDKIKDNKNNKTHKNQKK